MTTFIYSLSDPETGKIRYIGKTKEPEKRFKAHIQNYKKQNTHTACWIHSLQKQGFKPVFEILDEVPDAEWAFWEKEYIRVFRCFGGLTNHTDGGEGVCGHIKSTKTIEKWRKSMVGKPCSAETREKIRGALLSLHRRYRPSLSARENMIKAGKARRGFKHSAESKEKMRGRKCSQETIAKMQLAALKRQDQKRLAGIPLGRFPLRHGKR